MTNHELHGYVAGLLAAYALDALDADDRQLVEHHLGRCRACASEVDGHREVAARLVRSWPAPAGVWEAIQAALEEPPPALALVPVAVQSSRRLRLIRTGLVGVAAAAIAVLGLRVIGQEQRLDQLQTDIAHGDVERAALAALADPAAKTVELRAPGGSAAGRVAILPDGRGYLLADGLPELSPTRTYQLWALIDGQRISAGTLGPQPKTAVFQVSGRVGGFAVTEEEIPGAVASKNPPVLIGWLNAA